MWRRVRLIPFEVIIPDERQDKQLEEKLKEEWPGILAWAVAGCAAWLKDGLVPPQKVRAATAAYREAEDIIGDFITECLVKDPAAQIASADIYGLYKTYCEEAGERTMSQTKLGMELSECGYEKGRASSKTVWFGLGQK
jgi:putative DNA primase/helicase